MNTHLRNYWDRLRGGEVGSLPAVAGLLVLCTVFFVLEPVFLTPINFANLFTQGAAVAIIGMGLIFVLLLGEIDLSAGFASGVCASILAITLTNWDWPWYASVGAAILTGVVIGLLIGFLVAKVGIPSFVVTLAAFLAFQGVVLMILKEGTNISIYDPVINAIANRNMPPWLGTTLAAIGVVGFAATQLLRRMSRAKQGVQTAPLVVIAVRVGMLAAITFGAVYALNLERAVNPLFQSNRGVPIVVPLMVVLLIVLTFVLQRTPYGRHIYAVGGNREAARRAGIKVDSVRISVFVICSTLAAIGGIVAASRLTSVDPNTGGSNVLLYAVGAAVIGGTSLFGGKGRVVDAVLGGAVVAAIDNGMGLLGATSGPKYIFTGTVLLLAASLDALLRRRASAVR